MATPTSDSPLLVALRQRGCLLPSEEGLLRQPAVRDLEPRAQLAWLAQNRSVGRVVTLVAGGLRLVLLGGAALVIPPIALSQGTFVWLPITVSVVLAGITAWLVPRFVRRLRELSQPLPSWEELEPRLASEPSTSARTARTN